jgi:hypothetical protein
MGATFTIERAVPGDFDRIYPRLQAFGGPLTREDWRKIFVPPWKSPEDFCGYVLLRDGEVKGYLGLIFSSRVIGGRIEKFCNLTSWIVSDDARSKSLPMLLEVLKLKDYTITNFTASPTVAVIMRPLGFMDLDVHQQVLFPVPGLGLRAWGCACEFDPEKIRSLLSEDDRRIFDDHQRLGCEHLLLRSKTGYAYLVLKRTRRKNLPFLKVHYLSDPRVFVECAERLMPRICVRRRVWGLMVDERYLGGHRFRAAYRYLHDHKGYFKPASDALDRSQIDTIYSELVILHD